MNTPETNKAAVIADASRFQEACRKFLSSKIIYCVSSLMSDVASNLEETSRIFDFDYDEAFDWFRTPPDYAEALDQSGIKVFEYEGDWYYADEKYFDWDVIDEAITEFNDDVLEYEEDDEEPTNPEDCVSRTDFKTIEEALGFLKDTLAVSVSVLLADDEEEAQREACEDNSIDADDYRRDVYEHWIVESYFASRLADRGEVVFDFGGMTIWGRTTTGQSIYMDYVIEQMVRELDADHWIWGDCK